MWYLLLLLIHIFSATKESFIDFEKNAQDFVLETKQIFIPAYKGAFNPSIVRWQDKILLSFRVRDEHMISTFEVGLVWLNDDLSIASTPQILKLIDNPTEYSQIQDPRFIVQNEKLFIIYNNFITYQDTPTRRMFIAEVHYENDKFSVKNPQCLHPFEGCSKRWEKNWAPFIYNDTILFAYSLSPHRIVQPLVTGECVTVHNTESSIHWALGELRGGTPAMLDGDEYLAFFHTSHKVASTHSNGKQMPHYFMGAYTFSVQPPFNITRISPEPIVGKNFYNGPAHNTWKPLRVVFPMGYIMDEDYIWISYGRQDFEVWIAKIDKKGLYKSLVPCKSQGSVAIKKNDIDGSIYKDTTQFDPQENCL